MTTPSGQISLDDVNVELDIASGTQIAMGQANVRTLAEVPSGAISMSDLQGKSNAQFVVATGGTITTSGNYKIHTFNSSGTFTVNQAGNAAGSDSVEYVVVAGGASGGGETGGGGGAGGYRSSVSSEPSGGGASAESAISVSTTNYSVTVGAGGSAASGQVNGNPGSNSVFGSITSTGGGYGGRATQSGGSGGSGGGAGYGNTGGSGTANQGYGGGNGGGAPAYMGGGGGGAAGTGAQGGNSSGKGDGGDGVVLVKEVSVVTAAPGIWTMSDVFANQKAGTWTN